MPKRSKSSFLIDAKRRDALGRDEIYAADVFFELEETRTEITI